MKDKLKQYKNLILLVAAFLLVIGIIAADPLGFVTERRHQRSVIRNEIAIEKAEAEKRIAIIKAETDAELARIQNGVLEEQTGEEPALDTPSPAVTEETE